MRELKAPVKANILGVYATFGFWLKDLIDSQVVKSPLIDIAKASGKP